MTHNNKKTAQFIDDAQRRISVSAATLLMIHAYTAVIGAPTEITGMSNWV